MDAKDKRRAAFETLLKTACAERLEKNGNRDKINGHATRRISACPAVDLPSLQ